MAEFDTGLPSVRQIQQWVANKQMIELKLVTGDVLTGQPLWQDPNCICLVDADSNQTVAWRAAIVYHKAI